MTETRGQKTVCKRRAVARFLLASRQQELSLPAANLIRAVHDDDDKKWSTTEIRKSRARMRTGRFTSRLIFRLHQAAKKARVCVSADQAKLPGNF